MFPDMEGKSGRDCTSFDIGDTYIFIEYLVLGSTLGKRLKRCLCPSVNTSTSDAGTASSQRS